MKKHFSTIDTLKILLDYPRIMYQCIEKMDQSNDRLINESVLAVVVRQHIEPLDTIEQKRLLSAFDTNNLTSANVVSDIDKRDDGRFLLFQESVLTIFRLCEASLYKEVTDAKLKSRMASLWDAENRLESATFAENDPDYIELTEDITEQLGQLLSLLRNNIIAMERIGEKLESMTAEASRSPEKFPQYRQTMFEKTTHLFDRHIKPTLTFLDPKVRLLGGKSNLFDTLKSIRDKYRVNNKNSVADQILRYDISFSNAFLPIQKVERQVDHFLRKTRVGMLQYNAMEANYQKLRTLYNKTTTSNLKNRFMDASEFCASSKFALGLKQHTRPTCYQFGESIAYFENIFAEIELRLTLINSDHQSLFSSDSYKDESSGKQLERAKILYEWLSNQQFRSTKDVIHVLHNRLSEWLEEYQFTDLLTAIIHLSHKSDWEYNLITTNQFSYITIDDEAFIYRRRKLEQTVSDNNE